VAAMSQRCFSLLGDSNVKRNVSRMSRKACPALKDAEIIPCGSLDILAGSLSRVKSECTVCIISCLTNALASCEGSSSISLRVGPALDEIQKIIFSSCEVSPSRYIDVERK